MSQKEKKLKQLVIKNFGCKISQELYTERIKKGLLDYEQKYVNKYFVKNGKTLDLGCGTGRTSFALAKIGYKNITAVDLVPEFIEIAKNQAFHKNIIYQTGDATNLIFKDNYFKNIFFSYNGWSHIPDKNKRLLALKEIWRVLEKNGIFYFSTMFFRKNPFMFYKWLKFQISNLFNIPIWENDFGDVMFYRYNDFQKKYFYYFPQKKQKEEMKIYMHFQPSFKRFTKQLQKIGFEIVKTQKTFQSGIAYQMQIICKKSQP